MIKAKNIIREGDRKKKQRRMVKTKKEKRDHVIEERNKE